MDIIFFSVDLRFKEPEHPENGETVLTETDQRQKAYKHHDTMAEVSVIIILL